MVLWIFVLVIARLGDAGDFNVFFLDVGGYNEFIFFLLV